LASVNKQDTLAESQTTSSFPSHDARTHAVAAWLFKVRLSRAIYA